MTYTLQVVLLAALFLGLSDSGLLDESLDRRWLAGTIIAGTFVGSAPTCAGRPRPGSRPTSCPTHGAPAA